MEAGSTSWEADLLLGSHAVDLLALDAHGASVGVLFDLSLEERTHPHVDSVFARALRIDESGRRRVESLAEGTYTVSAYFPDGARVDETLVIPRNGPLELRAPPTGTLEVLVLDEHGAPSARAQVAVSTWTGGGPAPALPEEFGETAVLTTGQAGADGVARISGVRAGELRVTAYHANRTWTQPGTTEEAELAAEEEVVLTLVLPPWEGPGSADW